MPLRCRRPSRRWLSTSIQNSSAYVTVGAAMLDGLELWTGLGLDYYQAHWYDYMSSGDWCAPCTDYASLKAKYQLDAPLIIGEFYAGNQSTALRRDTYFATHGFAGAWPWSLLPRRYGRQDGDRHGCRRRLRRGPARLRPATRGQQLEVRNRSPKSYAAYCLPTLPQLSRTAAPAFLASASPRAAPIPPNLEDSN